MLDTASRAAIVAGATLSIAVIVVFAPIRARGSLDPATTATAMSALFPPAMDISDVPVARDPFSGEPDARPALATPVPAAGSTGGPSGVAVPESGSRDIGPLPSNLGTDAIPAIPGDGRNVGGAQGGAESARVTAVVTGAHPYAMLEIGSDHAIKGLGDRVHGKPIVAIDIDGVTLQGGARLTIAQQETSR